MADYKLKHTGTEIDAEIQRILDRVLSAVGIDASSTDNQLVSAKAVWDAIKAESVTEKNEEGRVYVGSTIRFCYFNSIICVETFEDGVWNRRNLLGHHINAPNLELAVGFYGLQQTSKEAAFQGVQDVFNLVKPDVDEISQTYGDYRKTTILVGSEVDPDGDVKISKFDPQFQTQLGATVTTTPITPPYTVGDEEDIIKGKYTHDIPVDITSLLTGDQVGVVWKYVGWYDDTAGGNQDNGSGYTYDVSKPVAGEVGVGAGETYGQNGFNAYTDFDFSVLQGRCIEANKVYNSLEEYKHLNGNGFTTPQGTLEGTIVGGVPTAQWNQQHKLAKDKLYMLRLVTDNQYTLKGDGIFPQIEAVMLPYRYETVATREEVDYVTIKNTDDLTTDQTISVINTYQDLVYTTEAFTNSSKFSVVSGVITYNGNKDILLEVNLSLSLQANTNNTTVTFALDKNGTEDKGIRGSRKMSSTTDTGSVSISSSVAVTNGDVIKWKIKADQTAIISLDNIQSVITKIVDL